MVKNTRLWTVKEIRNLLQRLNILERISMKNIVWDLPIPLHGKAYLYLLHLTIVTEDISIPIRKNICIGQVALLKPY